MTEQAQQLMVQSGATWVLWILILLSVCSLAVVLERARVFWVERGDINPLVRDLHRLLSAGDIEGAQRRLASSRTAAAQVVLAGLMQVQKGGAAAEEAMAAASGLERARLQRRLLFLGTVGNNAPFVGLLGTVIGIVGAFDELGRTRVAATAAQLAPERVMSSIAEALVATAIGLVVAIPAVALFNYFQGLLDGALSSADTLGHVLLTHIEPRAEAPAARQGA
jgi:biopolymer transport protein ExbB